jgi:hypothetical protein
MTRPGFEPGPPRYIMVYRIEVYLAEHEENKFVTRIISFILQYVTTKAIENAEKENTFRKHSNAVKFSFFFSKQI